MQRLIIIICSVLLAGTPALAQQRGGASSTGPSAGAAGSAAERAPRTTRARVKLPPPVRMSSAAARAAARAATGNRIVVSIASRRLWWIDGRDTLYSAPVAVGTGRRLRHGKQEWLFETPRGRRTIIGKEANPVWTPPEWRYVESARWRKTDLVRLERGRDIPLKDGSVLTVRGEEVGRVLPDSTFEAVPADEEIWFGNTIYIPPIGTVNRRIPEVLGAYKLDMGDGYLIHGTDNSRSIGRAATHGCIRMHAEALQHLFENVPIGTQVYIY